MKILNPKYVLYVLPLFAALALIIGVAQPSVAQDAANSESKTRLGMATEQPAEGPFVKVDGGFMVPYTATIPGTEIKYQMVPVPGGTFTMGSPDDEEGREECEGPQFEVVVKPFWMGKHEVTWGEYERFMDMDLVFKELARTKVRAKLEKFSVDAVTAPSELYDPDFTYSAGDESDQPTACLLYTSPSPRD